ncbi:MAG: primosomal protein N' [Bacteroidales bacterium]|nr:primosomal protein N' [Bacteroidales bacterium]
MTQSSVNYVDVILPLAVNQTFTYSIPQTFSNKNLINQRVIVQFGARKLYTGIVWNQHNNKPDYAVKPIIDVVDDFPIINQSQKKFWSWLSSYYMCSLGEIYKAGIPSGLKLESATFVSLTDTEYSIANLSQSERDVYNLLLTNRKYSVDEIQKAIGKSNIFKTIKQLSDKGIISTFEKVNNSIAPKRISVLSVNNEFINNSPSDIIDVLLNRSKKQKEVFEYIIYLFDKENIESCETSRIIFDTKCTSSIINSLQEKNLIIIDKVDPLDYYKKNEDHALKPLSIIQQQSKEEITEAFKKNQPVLLHGVTGSGKTEIYISLINKALEQGKQVLYLLPEIALTTQIISRLKTAFGDKVGVFHSRYSDRERANLYLQQQTGDKAFPIIVGARSAVFLPFTNLGLVIIDEEHEQSFKQMDPAPRYNGRDASIVLGSFYNANILLGSATPSIESYYNAKSGKYALVNLLQRHNDIKMPDIHLVNTRDARRKKQMFSFFSKPLFEAIEKAIENKEQIILFQNRRGFSPYVECPLCAKVPECPSCSVSLTYHKSFNNLTCHYCGYSVNLMSKCPSCHSGILETRGFGTEKIEDELSIYMPNARVERMDLDNTRRKNAFENIIDKFKSGEVDILVGTQMVTKGLDFDNVSVVGVLNADNMLRFPDFRAFERSFQLLTQVAGRAGRKKEGAKVYIQSTETDHPVLIDVVNNNYNLMYVNQTTERKLFNYPPFVRMVRLIIKHKNKAICRELSNKIASELQSKLGARVLGPIEPIINRIQTYYIMEINVKMETSISHVKVKTFINDTINKNLTIDKFKASAIIKDVDPS